jgi:hypothetical protein
MVLLGRHSNVALKKQNDVPEKHGNQTDERACEGCPVQQSLVPGLTSDVRERKYEADTQAFDDRQRITIPRGPNSQKDHETGQDDGPIPMLLFVHQLHLLSPNAQLPGSAPAR